MEIIYCPRDLRTSLLKVITSLNAAKVPLYSGYDYPQRYNFDFSILKQSLDKGDSLIVTLEPEGYPKLCLKVYPRTISLLDKKLEMALTKTSATLRVGLMFLRFVVSDLRSQGIGSRVRSTAAGGPKGP